MMNVTQQNEKILNLIHNSDAAKFIKNDDQVYLLTKKNGYVYVDKITQTGIFRLENVSSNPPEIEGHYISESNQFHGIVAIKDDVPVYEVFSKVPQSKYVTLKNDRISEITDISIQTNKDFIDLLKSETCSYLVNGLNFNQEFVYELPNGYKLVAGKGALNRRIRFLFDPTNNSYTPTNQVKVSFMQLPDQKKAMLLTFVNDQIPKVKLEIS